MAECIASRKAPANSVAPLPIPTKQLFSLDVNDLIWEDVGLDEEGRVGDPPLWLSEERVKDRIKGILQSDRCDEELSRVKHEVLALSEWFEEEWAVIAAAMEQTTGGIILQCNIYIHIAYLA